MQISVVSASSQTCREAIEYLLANSSARVVGLYRDLKKAPAHFKENPNFTAVYGNLTEASSLDFRGSDAVLAISPPHLDGSDYVAMAKETASNVRRAITNSGSVRRLVYISSIGAQYEQGVGEVKTNNMSERVYRGTVPEVIFVRNGYFMENWLPALETIMSDTPHFYSYLAPIDYKIPMVSVRDIGRRCAKELISPEFTEKAERIIDLSGPGWYSTRDVQEAFQNITGKTIEVRLVERGDLATFYAGILPASIVADFVEMTESFLPGGLTEDDMANPKNPVKGTDTLVDALTRMVLAKRSEAQPDQP